MKTFICSLFLGSFILAVASESDEALKHFTMVASRGSAVVKLYDGHLDSEQRQKATANVFDTREGLFRFIQSIPRKSIIHWTTACDLGEQIFIGNDTVLKKDLVEQLKMRDIVLDHRVEFF